MAINFNEASPYYENELSLSKIPLTENVIKFNKDNYDNSSVSRRKNKNSTNRQSADKLQLISQVTEKKIVNQKHGIFSSFSLAADIYKTNSDNCKSIKKINKKVKKSVLTLPNNPLPMRQVCTLSDFNDDDIKNDNFTMKSKIEQYPVNSRNKKLKKIKRDYEYYDRDAKYCSQMNINLLDYGPTDFYKGDCSKENLHILRDLESEEEFKPQDVWAVLRNINRFQFRPSPKISDEESVLVPRKKKRTKRRRNNKNDTRIIETLRTEEFAFISNINVDSTISTSLSQVSSFDRITVIEKDPKKEVCESGRGSKNNRIRKHHQRNNMVTEAVTNTQPTLRKDYTDRTLQEHKQNLLPKKYNGGGGESNLNSFGIKEESLCNANAAFNIKNKLSSSMQENSFICSGNSGSSKAYNNTKDAEQEKTNLSKITSKSNVKPASPTSTMQKTERKPRFTSIPSSITPKLTQTEIKRRLAHIKFPLVITGKDQVRSEIEVFEHEYSQFYGLDKQIWPFMTKWTNQNINQNRTNDVSKSYQKGNKNDLKTNNKVNHSANSKKFCQEIVFKGPLHKTKCDRKINDDTLSSKRKLIQIKQSAVDTTYVDQPMTKPKAIKSFKDKMVKLIYKKSSTTMLDNNARMGAQGDLNAEKILEGVKKINLNKKLINVGTQTNLKFNIIPKDLSVKIPSALSKYKTSVCLKYPWAKAKWASDFIDAVIGKLKNGVYYTNENKKPKVQDNSRNIAIQTTLTMKGLNQYEYKIGNFESTSKLKIMKIGEDPFRLIPGFDDTLPCLEIYTTSINQISIKHCIANVIVQFDVIIPVAPNECLRVPKLSSFVPLCTNSCTQILKSKTTLINSILPAELCSILPEMMRNINQINFGRTVKNLVNPVSITPEALYIPTRREISNLCFLKINSEISPFLQNILMKGYLGNAHSFLKDTNSYNAMNTLQLNLKYDARFDNILPVNISNSMKYCSVNIVYNLPFTELPELKSGRYCFTCGKNDCFGMETVRNTCIEVEKYNDSNLRILPAYKRLNIIETLESLLAVYNYCYSYVTMPDLLCKLENNTENRIKINYKYNYSHHLIPVTIVRKMGTYFFYNSLKSLYENENKVDNKIDNNANLAIGLNDRCNSKNIIYRRNHKKSIKIRNRSHIVRLNKKCKSTSNISTDRSFIPITKIVNLEDVFQALGTSKSLSTVMDGYPGEKIMKSILEMKNWTTYLSPKQALLVLLLTNKKDTPNLVRFRPILLQGIAVNRITRASELDMEIEVIERENFAKFPQFDGVDYFSALTENRDNLLEELFWIAKTTASDYQRPFDESSEKLLKSLLEKRKKLNPSYLRVMARYVGLGLLKTSNNS